MMTYLKVFLTGGLLCVIGEALILKTKLTPARILVLYITTGVILSAAGLYGPLVRFGAAGATVPLTGFGHALAQGVISAVQEKGLIGAFLGGLQATVIVMIGMKLKTKDAHDVMLAANDAGLLVLTAKDKLRLLPPLTITKEEMDAGLAILRKVLA